MAFHKLPFDRRQLINMIRTMPKARMSRSVVAIAKLIGETFDCKPIERHRLRHILDEWGIEQYEVGTLKNPIESLVEQHVLIRQIIDGDTTVAAHDSFNLTIMEMCANLQESVKRISVQTIEDAIAMASVIETLIKTSSEVRTSMIESLKTLGGTDDVDMPVINGRDDASDYEKAAGI